MNPMESNITDSFGGLLDSSFGFIRTKIYALIIEKCLEFYDWIMHNLNNITSGFFESGYVIGILNFLSIVAGVVLVMSIPFLLTDIGKNIDKANLRIVFTSFSEAIIYTFTIRWFPLVVWKIPVDFINNTNINISTSAESLSELSQNTQFSHMVNPLLSVLIISISAIIFYIITFKITADMFIHTISAVLYIPFIVRGDTKKIGEWLQQAVAISVTYVIQYISMNICLYSFFLGNWHIGIIFIFVAVGAGRTLKQWGHQTGTGSVLSSGARMLSQATYLLKSL